MGKVMIGGIKLSSELALVRFRHPSGLETRRWRLLQELSANRINIIFLTWAYTKTSAQTVFCVAAEDGYYTKELIQSENHLGGRVDFVPDVGALSLYPHRFSFEILGLSLHALAKSRVPIHALASSISSLTFITDYGLLDNAVEAVKQYLEWPRNQAPHSSHPLVLSGDESVDTIAVYFERRVKTYGFQVSHDLSMADIRMRPESLDEWSKRIRAFKEAGINFQLVLTQHSPDGEVLFLLVMERRHQEHLFGRAGISFHQNEENPVRVNSPVEMIHFQGPHFGDRYGILDIGLDALCRGGILVLAGACTGASISLILPEKTAEPAKALLEEVYEIPKRSLAWRKPS